MQKPPEQTTAIANAVDMAMSECPLENGRAVLSVDECERMVRAAIAAYLHETSKALGEHVCGEEDDEDAVDAERERCAEIADESARLGDEDGNPDVVAAAHIIARKIRSTGADVG